LHARSVHRQETLVKCPCLGYRSSMEYVRVTARQQDVLLALRLFWKREGIGPTLRELAEPLGISRVAVAGHLVALRAAGKVRQLEDRPGVTRNYAPVDPPEEAPRDA